MNRRLEIDYAYMDKVMLNPQREANTPGRILRCKPRTSKPPNGHTLWLGDLSIDTTEQDVIDFFDPCGKIEMICMKVNKLRNGHFGHVKFFETEALDKAVDLAGQLLKGFPVRMDFAEDKPVEAYRKEPLAATKQRPQNCHTVWVGGVGRDTTEEMIREALKQCGEIQEIRWNSGSQFCHVQFVEDDAVDRAMRLTGTPLGGSKIRVDYAEDRKGEGERREDSWPQMPFPGMPPPGMPPGWHPAMGPPPGMGPPGMCMPPGVGPPPLGPPAMPPPGAPPEGWLGPPGEHRPPPPGHDGRDAPPGWRPDFPPGGPMPPWGHGPPPGWTPPGHGPPPGWRPQGWPAGPPGWPGPPPPGYGHPAPGFGYPPPGAAPPGPPGSAPHPTEGPPGVHEPGRGRARSYSYSYSYTPSPERGNTQNDQSTVQAQPSSQA